MAGVLGVCAKGQASWHEPFVGYGGAILLTRHPG